MIVKNPVMDRAQRTARRAAFTLLEILVVVAIIVVLAGIGTVYLLPQLEGANEKVAKIKAREIGNAVQTYYTNNNGQWPNSLQELTQPGPDGKPIMAADGIVDPWGHPYTLDVNGPNHQGAAPDVYCTSPGGKVIGNWGR
jgi:general secretion pathway protein G